MCTSRVFVTVSLVAVLALAGAGPLLAAPPSLTSYFEFRVNSALPGMMFGVTPSGQVGFDGAFQQNIPVAYTPKSGNYVLHGDEGSNTSKLVLSTDPSTANGTAFFGFGLGGGNHPLYVSWEATSDKFEEAWNGQVQILRGRDTRPAISLGCLDVGNERQEFNPGAQHNARSVYVTATGAFPQATWQPIYWTLGFGNGRFQHGFGGLSIPLANHFKLAAEYDSLGTNVGVAYGLNGYETDRHWDLLAYFGYTDLKEPTLGLTATFN
jgi:hypothetical protein